MGKNPKNQKQSHHLEPVHIILLQVYTIKSKKQRGKLLVKCFVAWHFPIGACKITLFPGWSIGCGSVILTLDCRSFILKLRLLTKPKIIHMMQVWEAPRDPRHEMVPRNVINIYNK